MKQRKSQYELKPGSVLSELIQYEQAKMLTVACQQCIEKRLRELLHPVPHRKTKRKEQPNDGH